MARSDRRPLTDRVHEPFDEWKVTVDGDASATARRGSSTVPMVDRMNRPTPMMPTNHRRNTFGNMAINPPLANPQRNHHHNRDEARCAVRKPLEQIASQHFLNPVRPKPTTPVLGRTDAFNNPPLPLRSHVSHLRLATRCENSP